MSEQVDGRMDASVTSEWTLEWSSSCMSRQVGEGMSEGEDLPGLHRSQLGHFSVYRSCCLLLIAAMSTTHYKKCEVGATASRLKSETSYISLICMVT